MSGSDVHKSLPAALAAELVALADVGQLRFLRTVSGAQQAHTTLDGRPVLLLCSNNYLGLANHPRLLAGARAAVDQYGCSAGASRLISGTMRLHEELEEALAAFKKTPKALVFNSGYVANLALLTTLVGDGDVIYSDALNHASIVDGCRLSRARLQIYRHAEVDHLAQLLENTAASFRRRLIVTDSVFSMDGDLAPLPEIAALARRYDAALMVDDAHATGVLGLCGRGSGEYFCLDYKDIDLQMGTLGKALGSCGAYVAGDARFINYLINKARSFIYTTALPPAALGASLAAVQLLVEKPEMVLRLRALADYFRQGLRHLEIAVNDDPTPIVPVRVGDPQRTMALSAWFLERGVFIQGIRPPTVPSGQSLLRVTLSADLTFSDLDQVLALFAERRREFKS
ncbi:MAG: 8-amino-7-oxononanoate synthase [Deltaproteobacteria bacterium]|nr:8-amino-7-oxononanoate synthase [Deltaproteobacteria bacterium]